MKKALFLDFDDSFTYNVVQELMNLGLQIDVTPWDDFTSEEDHDLLVLGPGPGHPDDYMKLFERINSWISRGKNIFAVCLGHQILWRMRGAPVERSKTPLHGQQIKLTLPMEWQHRLDLPENISVQRYNSLAVKSLSYESDIQNFLVDDEIMISQGPNFISYQFHPESVGTKCRHSFFRPVLGHLL